MISLRLHTKSMMWSASIFRNGVLGGDQAFVDITHLDDIVIDVLTQRSTIFDFSAARTTTFMAVFERITTFFFFFFSFHLFLKRFNLGIMRRNTQVGRKASRRSGTRRPKADEQK